MATAHFEDLLNRSAFAPALLAPTLPAPAPPAMPRVIVMLQKRMRQKYKCMSWHARPDDDFNVSRC